VQGTPLAVGSGDSVVEALGAGIVKPGQCIVKLGTAGNVNVVAAEPRPDRRTLTYCHVMPGQWFTVVPTNCGAAAAAWFREAFSLQAAPTQQKDSLLVDQLAAEVAPGSKGLIFHPYLQGERAPHWDPKLRGGFVGVTVRHRQSHFARAVLEGVAFSMRDCMGLVRELGLPVAECTLMGGGARSALWRQVVADVLDKELKVFAAETTSYGAALIAGVAAGVYSDPADAARHAVRPAGTVQPDPANVAIYDRSYVRYQQVAQSLAPLYQTWNYD
jgi:xylulokinase